MPRIENGRHRASSRTEKGNNGSKLNMLANRSQMGILVLHRPRI